MIHSPAFLAGGLSSWNYKEPLPQLLTIFLVTLIIMILCLSYHKSLKKQKADQAPRGLALASEIFIKWIERQVIELMGTKYKFLTVYVIYVLLFVGFGNLMSIVGFESIVTAYTVPLSLGLVAFFGIYYFGFKYQKWAFFRRFLDNPLEIIQQFVPLVSISFRLFGNILGGSIIILLFTTLFNNLWGKIPYIGAVDFLGGMILPLLNVYFDIFDGLIQSYIFIMLTLSYWSLELSRESKETNQKERTRVIKVDPTPKRVQKLY